MGITLGRGNGAAEVVVDHSRCTMCRQCLLVCTGQPLYESEGRIAVDQSRVFGCIGCGQCVAVCPADCIEVRGRDLSAADYFPVPRKEERATFEQLNGLLLSRRSVRRFEDREVPREVVDQILNAAAGAPMGIPPSEVGVLVRHGREKVRELRDDMLGDMRKARRTYSPLVLAMMRPFMGAQGHRMMKEFVIPAMVLFTERAAKGEDVFMYDPPLALYFYASEVADPADPVVAGTYAMLAAEALGLGSCMLGFPGQILSRSGRLKGKYGLPKRVQPGIMIVMGYGKPRFLKGIRRRFASVDW